ncbi:hypothetical protein [Helicobacter sp.]|uniref:hypothetical protein n=1 Tax=Helicobacter sp. TaxID=218 RepID=UPI0025BDABFF|nr:hypothetical protein [Helicobacter sp.]MCI5968579.1 hypothetical protein [Helicobacter sp.]MDY2584067.1 hypothetical protein [Helicobacter sp.]
MKLKDFDFRLYVVSKKDYVRDEDKYQILADLEAKSDFIERLNLSALKPLKLLINWQILIL